MKWKRDVPEKLLGEWTVSGACCCAGADTQGFEQRWEHPRGCYRWSSSPGVRALDCEADPWEQCSDCYLTSPGTPDCSGDYQKKRRGSHEISSQILAVFVSAVNHWWFVSEVFAHLKVSLSMPSLLRRLFWRYSSLRFDKLSKALAGIFSNLLLCNNRSRSYVVIVIMFVDKKK